MNNLPPAAADLEIWRRLYAAARDEVIADRLRELYNDLDLAVQARGPTCWSSGKCCHFEAYGHRLYVTALEIAWLLQQHATPPIAAADVDLCGDCPFQQARLCGVHPLRPLGCRIFFCQAGTQDWQQELYEVFLRRLRQLHESHDLPYRYMEWRAGLAEALAAGKD